jgi:DNA invertase Pin-like site-specific DNA recombinase
VDQRLVVCQYAAPFEHLDVIAKAGRGSNPWPTPGADTTTPHGKLLITMLGGIAEFEPELIKSRTGDGRKRPRLVASRSVVLARLTAHQRQEAIKRREKGETLQDIARSYNVSHPTIMRPFPPPFCGRRKRRRMKR